MFTQRAKVCAMYISAALLALLTASVFAANGSPTVIHAGRLIDGTSRAVQNRVSIVIEGERIVRVEPDFQTPPGATIIDQSASTVLPGLIDSHAHVTARAFVDRTDRLKLDPAAVALRSVPVVNALLLEGFTSVRDVSASSGVSIALKRAIADGYIAGPRMWVAGEAIGPTGGHSDWGGDLNPEIAAVLGRHSIADGPDAFRLAVRERHRAGADLIKLMVGGGVMTVGDDPSHRLMDDDEIQAAIATAHALGMRVTAHSHSAAATNAALRLGIDAVEHGTFSDAESFRLFRKSGAYLVPTLSAGLSGVAYLDAHPDAYPAAMAAKARNVAPYMAENLSRAYAAGVKIAFGTDWSYPEPKRAHEFVYMVQAGMTPIDAILAATANAADLLGAADQIGSVQAGRFADLVGVAGDPLADVSELERVMFVMKGGVVVKQQAP